ncbi:Gfo/Idh/MocA family protein [Microbacterium sp. GCM10011525]|uniref:Gfo/Idh/MocA family protein n=1 Tax=unclassified Microbacterium TaxID=2609290 RepID=UPI0012F842E3|nr:Gfo/Idh/MocA family oxidoreductase [Microbacterium sp. MAH-37]MVQ41611.1 gfo/Idh/MocA family oxidoreductase [Microbacterium sp. MAH-37]
MRYAILGTGWRSQMYIEALAGSHADDGELVAWSDRNPGRLDWFEEHLRQTGHEAPARFDPAELADAVRRHRLDRVIITTPDSTHAAYVATALDAGADVIVEKPLTVDENGARMIAAAATRTGRRVIVAFNYRYSPRNTALREVIARGDIGEVTSVHFEWVLDTVHGADYFRRWHRDKRNSGGLLIHKSSHHFDLVNWWIADAPVRVFASGGLRFYGAENARRRGLGPRPERGSEDSALRDAFSFDLRQDPMQRALYYDQERFDGYIRDRDPFDEGITIEDNLSLVVDYARGASMTYSLNAHSPWEGYVVAINGTAGRAELTVVERGAILMPDGSQPVVDPSATPEETGAESGRPTHEGLVVQRHFGPAVRIPIPHGEGAHGGGDAQLLRDLFAGGADPVGRVASWLDGVRSMAVGLAGNRSLATGQAVAVVDLDLGEGATALEYGMATAGERVSPA